MQKISYNIIGIILGFLENKEILKSSTLTKKFHETCELDHIWRKICLRKWPMIHHRFDEPWKSALKRKITMLKGLKHGAASEFTMIPLRKHTGYITALYTSDEFILSGDSEGQLICWFEDESKYSDEDPEPFSSVMLMKSSGKILDIQVNDQKTLICAICEPNILEILEYSPELRKITHSKTIKTDLNFIQKVIISQENIFVFPSPLQPGKINIFDLRTGALLQKISYKDTNMVAIGFLVNYTNNGADLSGVWNQNIFNAYIQNAGGIVKSSIDKIETKKGKILGTIKCEDNINSMKIVGRSLFAFERTVVEIFDCETLKLIYKFKTTEMMIFNQIFISNDGPYYTIHYVNSNPPSLSTTMVDLIHKSVKHQNGKIKEAGHNEIVNSSYLYENTMVTASADMTIAVWDVKTGKHLYRLLGGSKLVKTKSFVENPTAQGFSIVRISEGRVVGVLGNLIRVYAFDVQNLK